MVRFSFEYDFDAETLEVTIFEARDLPAADENGLADPYIRVMLLPNTKQRFETLVLGNDMEAWYGTIWNYGTYGYGFPEN